MNITDLYKRIVEANQAYRNNTPIMKDAAYDALEDELRRLDPNHAHFKTVGAAPVGGEWPKVQHSIPMGSLNKAQFDADAAKSGGDGHADLKAWWTGKQACITHKLDGISIDLVYKSRKLVQAITRGDGDTGEDITRSVFLMQGAVKILPPGTPDTVYVRGEIICRKSDFAQHFKGESNPRNTAAGTAKRRSDNDKCKYLTVVAYQYMPDGVALDTKRQEMQALDVMGFVVPAHYMVSTLPEAIAIYDEYVASKRDALDWEIDGLVIDVNDRDAREALGQHNQRPKGAIAVKFPHAEKPTVLRNIRWQVGKSGRLTPVADFDTVNLGGRNISKASLAGVEQVEHMRLFIGCKVLVSLRNDVIPRIEANLDEGIENL